eukprot:992550-Prymnesium_polylepis.1
MRIRHKAARYWKRGARTDLCIMSGLPPSTSTRHSCTSAYMAISSSHVSKPNIYYSCGRPLVAAQPEEPGHRPYSTRFDPVHPHERARGVRMAFV